jgi:hypothetical protein
MKTTNNDAVLFHNVLKNLRRTPDDIKVSFFILSCPFLLQINLTHDLPTDPLQIDWKLVAQQAGYHDEQIARRHFTILNKNCSEYVNEGDFEEGETPTTSDDTTNKLPVWALSGNGTPNAVIQLPALAGDQNRSANE